MIMKPTVLGVNLATNVGTMFVTDSPHAIYFIQTSGRGLHNIILSRVIKLDL